MASYPGHETGFLELQKSGPRGRGPNHKATLRVGFYESVVLELIGCTEREVASDRTVLLQSPIVSELAAAAIGLEVDRRIGVEQVRDRTMHRQVLVDTVVRIHVGLDELMHRAVLVPRGRQGRAARIAQAVGRGRRARQRLLAGVIAGRGVRDAERAYVVLGEREGSALPLPGERQRTAILRISGVTRDTRRAVRAGEVEGLPLHRLVV